MVGSGFTSRLATLYGAQDRHHFRHPRTRLERLFCLFPFFADRGDHGAFRAHNHMGFQSQRFDTLDHVVNLVVRRALFHHDNHGLLSDNNRSQLCPWGPGLVDHGRAPFAGVST